jgi:hypothetical protein
MTSKTTLFARCSGVALMLTGVAKVVSAFGTAKILKLDDPVFSISFRWVMLGTGGVEIAASVFCFLKPRDRRAYGLIAWLSTAFIAYRLAVWAIGWSKPCPCLGNLTDALGIPPALADLALGLALAFMAVGSYAAIFLHRFRFAATAALRCALMLAVSLAARDAVGAEPTGVAAERLGSYLRATQDISKLEFVLGGPGRGDRFSLSATQKLYLGALRGNDFFLAELKDTSDLPTFSASRTLPISGNGSRGRWGILGQTVFLQSTNGGAQGTENPENRAVTGSKMLESFLDNILNLGISHADRGTLKVEPDGRFVGPIANRLTNFAGTTSINGQFDVARDGSLEGAEYHVLSMTDFVFHVRYIYPGDRSVFPPPVWLQWATRNGLGAATDRVDVLAFERATNALSDDLFQPERLLPRTNQYPFGPIIIAASSSPGKTYWLKDGVWVEANLDGRFSVFESPRGKLFVRIIFLVSVLIGGWLLLRATSLGRSRRV